MGKTIDETGGRYGQLTVIRQVLPNKRNLAHWLCRCDCGNECVVAGANLRAKKTRSCGCLRGKWSLPEGEASFNVILAGMKHAARVRGYEWGLTKEQVAILTRQPCFYCGIEPRQRKHYAYLNGDYVYNGLDRVDNSKGYTADNVVSCCNACNQAKSTRTVDEFRSWARRLYKCFVEESKFQEITSKEE